MYVYPRKVCPTCRYLNSEFVSKCEGVIHDNSGNHTSCGTFLPENTEIVTFSLDFTHLPLPDEKPIEQNSCKSEKVRICPNPTCGKVNDASAVQCTDCSRLIHHVKVTDRIDYKVIHLIFSETTIPMDFRLQQSFHIGRKFTDSMELLKNSNISRLHCIFHLKDGNFFLEDVSSKGTSLNSVKITSKTLYPIKNGDLLSLYNLQGKIKFYAS